MSQTKSEAELFILKYPFTTAAGESIPQLTLKRLTVKDLKQVKKVELLKQTIKQTAASALA